jgi:hypothetical protein
MAAMISLPFVRRTALAQAAYAMESLQAFAPGEKLTYDLGWQFIVAGRATLEVFPDREFEGRKVRKFRMTARTHSVVDHLFKVRDTLTSITEYDVSRALAYKKIQREGDEQRDETVHFDWENLQAHYHEELSDNRKTTPIRHGTLDPLSAFYYVRNQSFDVGSVLEGPLTDGQKCKIAQIKVVERDTIKVNGTRYDAFKLVPDIKDLGGVFKKSSSAKMEIWCTADHRHIPVLLKSKVIIGSFKAELTGIETA